MSIDPSPPRPPPLTPPYADLRGYGFMPLFGAHLFGSRFYALARRNPRAGLAGLKLWWEAWVQRPAASLPADDFDLADLAGFGDDVSAWLVAKATAMHGFVMCDDGRWYHPFLAVEAIKAFEMRLKSSKHRTKERERLRLWRANQKGTHGETRSASTDETRFNTQTETPCETRFDAADSDNDSDKTKDSLFASVDAEKSKRPVKGKVTSSWHQDAAFVEFYQAYPRKIAPPDAHRAWLKAMKAGATPAEIMSGLAVYRFEADEKYIKHPSAWLNGGYWQSSPATAATPPPPAPKPLTAANGQLLDRALLRECGS